MPACSASAISLEQIEVDGRSVPAIRADATRTMLERWCITELEWVHYESNSPPVWQQVVRHLRGYLGSLWVSGGLPGTTLTEAFFVRCDRSTMTQQDISENHVICLVGLASVKPAEFVLYRVHIHQKRW